MLKPDWISSSSVTTEDFVCTQVGPVFSPCSLNSRRRASFQADRREPENLMPSRRKDAVLLISLSSTKGGTKRRSTDPEKKALFVCWKLLGRLVTVGANAAQS